MNKDSKLVEDIAAMFSHAYYEGAKGVIYGNFSDAEKAIDLVRQSEWISEELVVALGTLSVDMHTKSQRPCSTCARISDSMGKHFGCSVYNGYRLPSPPTDSEE